MYGNRDIHFPKIGFQKNLKPPLSNNSNLKSMSTATSVFREFIFPEGCTEY